MMKSLLLLSSLQLAFGAAALAQTPPSAMQAPAGVGRMMGASNSPYTASTAKEFAAACKLDERVVS